jgi:hypothetical protein
MQIVIVKWRDITSQDGWHSANKLDNFIIEDDNLVVQIGFLYEEDEDKIVLLDSYFEKKDLYGGVHKIPRGCIVSIQKLDGK